MNHRPTNASEGPSDLELMLYADGELDEDRRPAVEAYLARSTAASSKLAGLNLVSGMVRERSLADASPADDIADAIMAKISANGASAFTMGPQAAPNPGAQQAPHHAPAAPAPKAKPSAVPVAAEKAPREKPANDNARSIFALAAIAVAAAAGLMVWSRMDTGASSDRPVAAMTATHEQLPTPPAPAKTAEPAPDAEDEHGVEVSAVDFGARMGTIFYVPTGSAASNATTTVVWLNDDAAGGE